jgi:acetyltransferase
VGIESFTERLGKALDLGNSADLDFVDALDYLEEDPETEIIALHMEGLKRGREFLRAAFRVSRKKPILVFKTGRSKEGAKAALSHTGSMVGEDSVYEKAFSKAGIVRVRNMLELSAASRAFLNFKPMQGPRIAVITAAGAAGIIALDAFADHGLKPAPFAEEIGRQLESSKVAWHKLHNPVDIWPIGMITGSFTRIFKEAGKLLLKDDQVDGILGVGPVMQSELHKDLDIPRLICSPPLAVLSGGLLA